MGASLQGGAGEKSPGESTFENTDSLLYPYAEYLIYEVSEREHLGHYFFFFSEF